jgi:hypothetical protein
MFPHSHTGNAKTATSATSRLRSAPAGKNLAMNSGLTNTVISDEMITPIIIDWNASMNIPKNIIRVF